MLRWIVWLMVIAALLAIALLAVLAPVVSRSTPMPEVGYERWYGSTNTFCVQWAALRRRLAEYADGGEVQIVLCRHVHRLGTGKVSGRPNFHLRSASAATPGTRRPSWLMWMRHE